MIFLQINWKFYIAKFIHIILYVSETNNIFDYESIWFVKMFHLGEHINVFFLFLLKFNTSAVRILKLLSFHMNSADKNASWNEKLDWKGIIDDFVVYIKYFSIHSKSEIWNVKWIKSWKKIAMKKKCILFVRHWELMWFIHVFTAIIHSNACQNDY